MDIYIPKNIERVIRVIEDGGYEAYIVGGCVRDSLLGKEPKDYDIATSASPEKIKELLGEYHTIDTGIQYGTITVVSEDDYVEVTTFRVDGEYNDNRRPDNVMFSDDLIQDLARRDFTVNAMAYNHRTGIIDKYGGQKDLFMRKIRCVGNPIIRFNEDALRIMRALRFASQLNFEPEVSTAQAIHKCKNLLKNVASERIAKELDGILVGDAPANVLTDYSDVISVIIPEVRRCIGFNQHSRHQIYDIWTHTAIAVENSDNIREVRLALLLHDIAKPDCCCFDDEGNGHFPGHERAGVEIAERVLQRLHYSSEVISCVSTLIKYHYVTPVDDRIVVKQLLSKLGKDCFFKLTAVIKGDSRAMQSFCFERVQILESMEKKANEIINNKECINVSQLLINGYDIIMLGAEGPKVGDVLNALLSAVIDEKIPNERERLLDYAKEIIML